MIDTIQKIYDYLAASDAYGFFSAVSTRVWSPIAPADFKNATAAVIYHRSTEGSHPTDATHDSLFTFKCAGGIVLNTDPVTSARLLYGLLHDKLHGRFSYANSIIRAEQVGTAQDLVDPKGGWPYVQALYSIAFNQT